MRIKRDLEVQITFRVSWRRDFSDHTKCDASTKDKHRLIGYNTGDMECLDGCMYSTVKIGTMEFYCTDFSEDENWTSGENTLRYIFPESKNHWYQFGFKGNAWISSIINMRGGDWMLRTTASLAIRNDTGKINSSPKSVMQPIVRLQFGCNHTITIPAPLIILNVVSDPDKDDVRCRWAIPNRDECGDICNSFSDAEMYERECTISYSPKWTGWYGVAVQIEDFNSTESMEELSSVPLQFLVVVFNSNTTCASKPTFVEPTRVDGSCIGIPFNTTYYDPIVSRSGSQNISIREIQTSSPRGMLKSGLGVYSKREWYVNISWTPVIGQAGPQLFCYTALDSNGANSDKICVKLLVGVSPPDIIEVQPVGDIFPNHNIWTIKFDKQFERPSRTTFIYFKERDTGAVVYKIDISTSRNVHFPQGAIGKTLTVHTNFVFKEKNHYYVNLDPGAGRGKTDYCKVESPPIRNKTFWSFRIRDVTKPELTFKLGPTATNGSITISWTFNEPVTSSCTIVKPDRTHKSNCNNSWSGDSLKEGFYTLFIFGKDLEGNQADIGKYEFQIDTTPPNVFINVKPHAISKHRHLRFSFSCSENCRTYCSFYEEGNRPIFRICKLSYQMFSLKDNTAYVFVVKAVDTVGNEGNNTFYRFMTDFTPPTMTNLPDRQLSCGEDFNPNKTGVPIAKDNNANGTNIFYTDSVTNNCGIKRVWTATDAAGNEANQTQVILFKSSTPISLLFGKEAVVACGDINDFTKKMKQFISKHVIHPCGIPFKRLNYTDSRNLNNCGITIIRTWYIEDSCGSTAKGTQQIKILQMEVPVTPKNGQTNVELQSTLRWPSYPKATKYEIYVEIDIGKNSTIPSPKWSFETRKIPDLTVESVAVQRVAFSGQSFVVQWTVRNIGSGITDTSSWNDFVYYSFIDNLADAKRLRHSTFVRQRNILFSNDEYTSHTKVTLQKNDIGLLRVFVETGYYDYNTTNNVLASDHRVDVKLTPPPDLQVDSIIIPDATYSGNTLDAIYTVRNHGDGATIVDSWIDDIYWSADNILDKQDFLLKRHYRNGKLVPDESYTVHLTVPVPRNIYGNYTIIVHSDSFNNVYEHGMDKNNKKVSKILEVVLTAPPDLRIKELLTEKKFFVTGDTMVIQWTVFNDGYRSPYALYWRDDVSPDLYIYRFKVISEAVYSGKPLELKCLVGNRGVAIKSDQRWYLNVIISSTRSQYTDIVSQKSVQLGPLHTEHVPRTTTSLQIPISVHGKVYLHCIVETNDDIFEGREPSRLENNHKVITLFVNRPPSPDLLVSVLKVSLKNSSSSQTLVSVTWSVQNIGNSMPFRSNWLDAVGISHQNHVHISDMARHIEKLNTFEIMYGLEPSASYSMSKTVVIPKMYIGTYYIYVITDYANSIFEFNGEENNIALGSSIIIPPIPMAQLNVVSFLIDENTVTPGSSISASFLIENNGSARTRLSSWEDLVYICPIQNASKQDLLNSGYLLSTTLHVGALYPGEIYLTNVTLIIPNYINNQIFFYVLTIDNVETGLFVEFSSQASSRYFHNIAISVDNNRLPNMIVSANESIGTQKGGQPLSISYYFTNNGDISSSRVFYNSFYLSDDYRKDAFDLKLRTSYYSKTIAVNETVNDTVSVFLPYDLKSRNYFIIIEVDSGNSVYEFDELDNEFVISMSVEQTLSTDVAVVDVKTAQMVSYGDNLDVHWKLRNNGTISAHGYTCDSVFLSADRKWDIEDKQIGQTTCRFITLQPYNQLSSFTDVDNSLTGKIPEMSEASYVAVVKSRSNILDKHLENNVGIGTNNAKLFRLPNISSEETLVISAECKSIDTFYEIKVKYGKEATDVDFDFVSDDPFKSNQTITIPMTKSGSYYLLVTTTDSGQHVSSVNVNLLVKLARFEILRIFPTRAIPLGNATLKIEGTLFPEEVIITLFNETSGELRPLKIFRFSSTLLYATFDFRFTDKGQRFSLNLTNSLTGNTTVFEDAIEISTGEVGKVSAQIDVPNALLPGQRGLMYLYLKNIGDTDIVSPLIFIRTNGIAHLNVESDSEEAQYWKHNIIIAGSKNTPGGVLPPGASYRFVFNVKQVENSQIGQSKISVNLIKPLKETNHVYLSIKDQLRTSDLNDEAWDRIWDNFIKLIGTSWYSLNWKVSEVMNQLSLAGRNVIQLSDVISLLLDMAGGHNEDITLTQENDIIVRRKSRNLVLDFRRFLSSKIFSRYHKSVMGRGWMLPYWSTNLNAVLYDEANVTFSGISYIFTRQVDGIYQNKYLGELLVSSNDTNNLTYTYTDKVDGREYIYSNETGLLIAIKSIHDNSYVNLHYKDSQLQQIEHSDGPYLVMTYNERGFINWVELRNDSDNEQGCIYDYDMENDWLISSDVNGKITRYEYNIDNSIKRIKHPSGSIEEFEYYPQGWLKSSRLIKKNLEIAKKLYNFMGEALITTITHPDNVTLTLTYDENGETALRKRLGFSTEKIENTEHATIISQGDFIISKNIYDKVTNSVLCEDANGDFLNVTYNDHGRVTVLKDSDNNVFSVTYNPDGNYKDCLIPR
ncbi:unnamed protein product [Mytilus coruscus]|uniref:CARDB domain-containing protein n=1 Tax=Mytilus coruscus TaxID=42192 RepID=A0A6J8D5M1_MYTCO|nr:unnamed protein product [Mytilus coruscus]